MRELPRYLSITLGLMIVTLVVAGCSRDADNLPREPISGTVTFDGQPLKSGIIQLQPASAQEGIAAGGMITDGHFEVPRKDGPVPGKYHVIIFAQNARAGGAEGAMPGEIKAQKKGATVQIPARYNFQTELAAEVKLGGPNRFTFDLKP